jgi:Zn-dependent protease
MFITVREIIDIVLMTLAIGYIFSTFIKRQPSEDYDPLTYYKKNQFLEDIKFGAMIAAPAVVLHELAHKFVAMGFGATATLHAPLGWYAVIIVLRLLNFPLLFFVGGYVTHSGLPSLQSSFVSIAGPLTNLILYGLFILVIKFKLVHRKHYRMLAISAKLNLFLAVFNMIPIPGFDGYWFFRSLLMYFGF